MQIPAEKIQEVLERTDMVALVSRHVSLKKSGRSFLGLCPFHGEKTPSFHVNPEWRSFKCFGCGIGGDAISFVQQLSGCSFVEAVRDLAKEAGVELDERVDPAQQERARLLEASELARRHFEERLWNDPRALPGRQHLESRQVDPQIARHFGLGYALNSWNDLSDRLVKEGVLEQGARAGLCAPRKSGGYFDVFRGRLMVPIRSPEGRTIAFGARLVEQMAGSEPGPKYLNSRDTPLYRKGEILYGLDLAKEEIRKRKSAVLVEGYFDVIGLYSAGVRNSVALCSTALTPGHLAVLERFGAKELVLLLDGDAAGVRAVEKLAGPILAAGVSSRVATLPQGDDPDTFALREGSAAVEELFRTAPPLSTHLLEQVLPRGAAHGYEEKMAALTRLRPIVAQMAPGMARSLFIGEIASYLGVPESAVRADLSRELRPPAKSAPPAAAPASPGLDVNEAMVAALLMADASLRVEPDGRQCPHLLPPAVRVLVESENPMEGLEELPKPVRAAIEERLAEIARSITTPEQRRQALRDGSRNLRLADIERRLAAKQDQLARAQEEGRSEEEIEQLQREHHELSQERKQLRARSGVNP